MINLIKQLLCLVILLVWAQPAPADGVGPFDFYVMSLSWSPEFCQGRPEESQCSKGYGLVLHGLWPQYTQGYPEFCGTERLSKEQAKKYDGLYPSESLAYHEWQKHGTCSGLTADGYLNLSAKLKQSFVIPDSLHKLNKPLRINADDLSKLFLSANPRLKKNSLAFSCNGRKRFLKEVYVCFDQKGENPTACSLELQKRSRRSCGQSGLVVRNRL
ncbi:MAG: ribonuclease T2 family protein [Gammaproteobacteria bacterium]